MPRALGTFLKLGASEKLTRHHYYLQLPDQLMDIVERDPVGPQAERLAELAHSFSHDLLNLAVLASRLLWYEGVTSDMSRSPDLPAVSTDVESYFLFLKAACDLLAEITVEVAIDAGRRGQAPAGSFHDLTRWVRENPARVDEKFHFLAKESEWFDELHAIRTNLAHRGYDTLVYTNRVIFSFGTAPFGRIETRLLREDQGHATDSRKVTRTPLLPFIKRLTQSMLRTSEQLAMAAAAYRGLAPASKTHALCGVYVPALHAISSYEPPMESPKLKIIADCLQGCEDYLTASKIGFPDGHWWRFLVELSERFGTSPAYIGPFGEGPVDILLDWKLIFVSGQEKLGIVARDMIATDKVWLENAQENLAKFATDAKLTRVVLVARRASPPFEAQAIHAIRLSVVVDELAPVAADAVFKLLGK